MIDFEIYRNEYRTIAWGPGDNQSARPGHVIVDPPEYIVERNGDQLVRIDEDGYVPQYDLANMRLEDAKRIAARADTDEVDANSTREEIINALAPDVEHAVEGNQSGGVERESDERDTNAWEQIEEASGQSTEELAAESVESSESESGESEPDESDEE